MRGRSGDVGGHAHGRTLRTFAVAVAFVGALLLFGLLASSASATTVPSNFFVVPDAQGTNDVPGQVDLTVFGRDTSQPGLYNLFWDWDSVNFTSQTGDACALFDFNGNGNIDAAVCGEVHNGTGWTEANPVVQQTVTPPNHGFSGGPPYVFRCGDSSTERCSNPSEAQPYSAENVKAGVLSQGAGGMPGASPPGNLVTSGIDPFLADD